MEEVLMDLRGIASVLQLMGNRIGEQEYAVDFLAKKLLECADILEEELRNLKQMHI